MRAFVTGGTGFVGGELIRALRAAGHPVRALVRPSGDRAAVERAGAEPFPGDLDQPATLAAACDGCDVVYHAAARVDIVGSTDEFHRTTVAGTAALLDAARRAGVRRFVHVSSCAVYHPRQFRAGVIREDTPVLPPPRWSRYGRAKLAAERLICEATDIDWSILRLGWVYGPGNRSYRQYLQPFLRDRKLRIIGRGDNPLALVHVDDAARAILLAGTQPAASRRILLVAHDEPITQRQFMDALADAFAAPRIKDSIPFAAAFAFAAVCEWLGLRPLQGTLSRNGICLTGLPQRLDCSATRQLLNWTPEIPFTAGMRDTADWFRQHESASQRLAHA